MGTEVSVYFWHEDVAAADSIIEAVFAEVDRICGVTKHMYKTTNATASECLSYLDQALLDAGMEPGCVMLWQTFLQMKEEEEEWDGLTAEEQAKRVHVPKGKVRKEMAKKTE